MEDLVFGPFTINATRRILLRDGVTVPLGSRAVDILIHLATHAGELQSNAAIVKQVWPDTFVEEANLRRPNGDRHLQSSTRLRDPATLKA